MTFKLVPPTPWCVLLLYSGIATAQTSKPANERATATVPRADGTPTEGANSEAAAGPIALSFEARLRDMQRGNGLTSAQVALRAVGKSARIDAKRRSLEAAEASVAQSKAAYLPEVSLSARYTRLSNINAPTIANLGSGGLVVSPDGTARPLGPNEPLAVIPTPNLSFPVILNNYSLDARLNVPLSDYVLRVSHSLNASKRSRRAAELDQLATRLAVARDARVAYYDWVGAQCRAYVALQGVEQARGHLLDAKNGLEVGLASKADALAAESAQKNAELLAERAKNDVALATERIRVLLQDPTSVNYEIGENVLANLSALSGLEPPELPYREALSKRLELRQLEESQAALREQATAVRQASLPRLDASAGAAYANPNQRYFPQKDEWRATWDASVTLSWKPSSWFGSDAAAKVIEARAAELAAERAQLCDALRLEIDESIYRSHEAEFALLTSRQELAAAEESYRARRDLFQGGRATLTEVTDAETALTRARLELVNAHIGQQIGRVQLEHALGRDIKPALMAADGNLR